MKYQLVLLFKEDSLAFADAWQVMHDRLLQEGVAENKYDFQRKLVKFDAIKNLIENNKKHYICVIGKKFEANASLIFTAYVDQILIDTEHRLDWDLWVEKLSACGNFTEAFLVDDEYDTFQNRKDPMLFEPEELIGLPMIHNGKPHPLGQMIVDISSNPGRRLFKEGYIEVVSSRMWFGPYFWELAGSNPQTVVDAGFVLEGHSDLYRLHLDDEPFKAGSDVDLQNRLRDVLFS